MRVTTEQRLAMAQDALRGHDAIVRELGDTQDAYDAWEAWEALRERQELLAADLLVEIADRHGAAALARYAGTSRQAMHERVNRARTKVEEAAEQY